MKKLLLALGLILFFAGCGSTQSKPSQNTSENDALQVLYFHGKQRCVTCRAIETLTKEVLDKDFAKQTKSGKIVFKVIDISTAEGEKVADKYEITWSSLVLDYKGKVVNLTDMGFSYAKNEPETFKNELRTAINQLLK